MTHQPASGHGGTASTVNEPGGHQETLEINRETSGLAVAAMWLGALGLGVPLFGILGIVLGKRAIDDIDRSALLFERQQQRIDPESQAHSQAYGSPRVLIGRGIAQTGVYLGTIGTGIMLCLFLFALAIPATERRTGGSRQMRNSTQLRGIHQAMETYAQSNKFWFPGATSTGRLNAMAVVSVREASIGVLQNDDYFTPEYAVSWAETDPQLTGDFDTPGSAMDNGSFAVLDITGQALKAGEPMTRLGQLEWRDTLTTTAVVLADRHYLNGPSLPNSIWAVNPGTWQGSVLYNDNHVTFELTCDQSISGAYGTNTGKLGTGVIGHLFDETNGDGRLIAD